MKHSKPFIIKLLFSILFMYYLIEAGRIDFTLLSIFWDHPIFTIIMIPTWGFGIVYLSSMRWEVLLKASGIYSPFSKVRHLTMTGVFFNTIMPGAVGGDFMKALYIWKDHEKKLRKTAVLTVFFDRIVGVFGLFIVGFLAIILQGLDSFSTEKIYTSFFIIGFFLSILIVFWIIGWKDTPPRIFSKISFLNRLVHALQLQSPRSIKKATSYAVVVHLLNICLYLYITVMIMPNINLLEIIPIIPLGVLASSLPIAPAGLGVGHAAFEGLFLSLGYNGGANVFNLVFITQVFLSLICGLPLIFQSEYKISFMLQKKHN